MTNMVRFLRRVRALSLASVTLAVLAACNLAPTSNPRVPPAGSSDLFSQAYLNGCRQGAQDANPTGVLAITPRDDKQYASAIEYKKGWDQGHAACYEDERRAPVMEIDGGGGDNH
jgi:hypothetical protein